MFFKVPCVSLRDETEWWKHWKPDGMYWREPFQIELSHARVIFGRDGKTKTFSENPSRAGELWKSLPVTSIVG